MNENVKQMVSILSLSDWKILWFYSVILWLPAYTYKQMDISSDISGNRTQP